MRLLVAALLLVGHIASGQTFFNVRMLCTNYVGAHWHSEETVTVPTNTTARILSFVPTADVIAGTITAQFPGLPGMTFDVSEDEYRNIPVLGPLSLVLSIDANTQSGAAVALIQFDAVNTAAGPGGTLVQPAGFSSSVALQTSTNLTTWSTVTNTVWGKTNASRFFRMSQTIP